MFNIHFIKIIYLKDKVSDKEGEIERERYNTFAGSVPE